MAPPLVVFLNQKDADTQIHFRFGLLEFSKYQTEIYHESEEKRSIWTDYNLKSFNCYPPQTKSPFQLSTTTDLYKTTRSSR